MTPDDDRPGAGTATSDFDALFHDLIVKHIGRIWVVDGGGYSAWNWPEDWLIDGTADRLHDLIRHGRSVPGRFMAEHADRLSDLNLDISLLAQDQAHLSPNISQYDIGTAAPIQLSSNAIIGFSNFDAAYWAIIARSERPIAQLRSSWRHVREIEPKLMP